MKLWIKIGIIVTVLITCVVASIVVLMEKRVSDVLREEQRRCLYVVAEHIAEKLTHPLLLGQVPEINEIIRGHKARDEEISYIVVRDGLGNVVGHTFSGDVPEAVRNAEGLPADRDRMARFSVPDDTLSIVLRIEKGSKAELHLAVSERPRHERIRAINREIVSIGAAFVLLGAGLSFGLSYRITRPLQAIVHGLHVIRTGDLDHRIAVTSRDEIGALAVAVNETVESRREAEDEIMKLNFELEENVEQRTAQLTEANKEMEAFAYSVSHDLRAPLRSIDGFSKALLDDYLDKIDTEGRDHLKRIRKASQRMGQLIDDMLKLSRLTRGEILVEQVDVSAMAREVLGNLQASDPGRSVKVKVQEDITGAGDRKMIRVVLENLLGNAWKYTSKQAQARIMFGVAGTGGSRAFFIKDNGAGFDMAYSQKLFGVFQRLHSEHDFPGTGIGLATVQRIIHRHGGKVWAEGEVGKGATFYFTLGREASC